MSRYIVKGAVNWRFEFNVVVEADDEEGAEQAAYETVDLPLDGYELDSPIYSVDEESPDA